MLSKLDLDYSTPMLIYSLYFWDNTHYTFHLPCGMVAPTLFDMAAIIGMKPTRHTYDPDFDYMDTIAFSTTRAAYSTHISHYHDKDTEVVSDVEHIAFFGFVAVTLCIQLKISTSCQKISYPAQPTACGA